MDKKQTVEVSEWLEWADEIEGYQRRIRELEAAIKAHREAVWGGLGEPAGDDATLYAVLADD